MSESAEGPPPEIKRARPLAMLHSRDRQAPVLNMTRRRAQLGASLAVPFSTPQKLAGFRMERILPRRVSQLSVISCLLGLLSSGSSVPSA